MNIHDVTVMSQYRVRKLNRYFWIAFLKVYQCAKFQGPQAFKTDFTECGLMDFKMPGHNIVKDEQQNPQASQKIPFSDLFNLCYIAKNDAIVDH